MNKSILCVVAVSSCTWTLYVERVLCIPHTYRRIRSEHADVFFTNLQTLLYSGRSLITSHVTMFYASLRQYTANYIWFNVCWHCQHFELLIIEWEILRNLVDLQDLRFVEKKVESLKILIQSLKLPVPFQEFSHYYRLALVTIK